jgi:CHAT domain-containing protein/Tfp pilus assembly protein PilF
MCFQQFARLVLVAAFAMPADISLPGSTHHQPAPRGVVVEEVASHSSGEKAGIRVGDVLLSWVRAAAPPANPEEARGDIASAFDFAEIEQEQAPRGPVTLFGNRDGASFSVTVPPGAWAIRTRPQLAQPQLSAYLHGQKLIAAADLDKGISAWRELATQANRENDSELAAWLSIRIGATLANARRWDEAHAAFRTAADTVKDADSPSGARIVEADGSAFEAQNDFLNAEAAYREALRIRESRSRETLAGAASLTRLGVLARVKDDSAAAEGYFRRALGIAEKLAPESAQVAMNLSSLGSVASGRGDLATAEQFHRRALAIRERLTPDGVDVAASLNNLGAVLRNRGDLLTAGELHERALAIYERVSPDSLPVASILINLSVVAFDRGDLARAEEFLRRSLAIQEGRAPGSLAVAVSLNNLGEVARERRDFAAATDFYKRSLAIKEKLAPDTLTIAMTLNNLGSVARNRGELASAEEFHLRALTLREKLAPDSLAVSTSLHNLALVARDRGDLAAAERLTTRALHLAERRASHSLEVARSLENLADLALQRGDFATSEERYQRTLAIRRQIAPLSSAEARALHGLALVARRTGRQSIAAEYLERAIAAVEAQTSRIGSVEDVRAGYAASYGGYYKEYVDLLLELDQRARAFHVLERSRARSLLAMLAERDLVFASDLPADLAHERTLLNGEYDRVQSALAGLNPANDGAEIDRLAGRLRELRDKREEIAQAIRKASPRFASLHYPQPLDLAAAEEALDPGTVLLAYSVAAEKTVLFVVQSATRVARPRTPSVAVFTLPIGEATLRERVAAFRSLIQRDDSDAGSSRALRDAGTALFETLIQPAHALLAASDRVVISPDGPLHTLPFGALLRPGPSATAQAQYFIQWKPIHVVASATIYAELKKTRRDYASQAGSPTLAAFGDPTYPPFAPAEVDAIANADVRQIVRRGYRLAPLPATRKEVEALGRVFGSRATLYLGNEATEERAKSIGEGIRYLHFAGHGLLDERYPLNSALALTIPAMPADGQANGLLQAWEIFEQMRIDADLVTLSACESALGTEIGGEGLVGLTRAFQYAGARTILASLWSVGDDSTAQLMTRFYGHLKAGTAKDEALRRAQIDLIRGGRQAGGTAGTLTHPYHWAAFQLIGDWK